MFKEETTRVICQLVPRGASNMHTIRLGHLHFSWIVWRRRVFITVEAGNDM